MATVWAGGTPNFDEKTGQYKQAYQAAQKPFDPSAILKQHGFGDYKPGSFTQVAASSAPTPSNQIWAQAWNQARPQSQKATPQANTYTAPGEHYRQQLRFDGKPQAAPARMGSSDFGNYAYAQDGYRPAAFTQKATDFTGAASESPDFARRDAFIDQLNARLGSYQSGVYSTPQPRNAPSYDVQALWENAGKMVRNGWRNPFSRQSPLANA
jgi:hypothetical protein